MAKQNHLGIRISDEMKAALDEAAREEERTVSSFVEVRLSEWLRREGYLEKKKAKK